MALEVQVPRAKLGPFKFDVSAQGLGCVGMSAFYGPPKPEADMIDLIRFAVDSGITFLDTAEVYGPHTNEILLGKAIKGIREKFQIATKFGSNPRRGDPEYVRSACEASLKRLDIDCIDLYYQHRMDPKVPIEITVGEMKKLVEEGKVRYIGLSEASAATIRRAHAVHPITAVQLEWSLWSHDAEEEIIPTCRELGIAIVAYSPLGRGFLSSGAKVAQSFSQNDIRKDFHPRFQEKALEKNNILFEKLSQFAAKKGCTPGQIALAWVHHQGDDVVPIPGTTKLKNLKENLDALHVKLTQEEMQEIQSLFNASSVVGDRYQDMRSTFGDTPPLSSWKSSV